MFKILGHVNTVSLETLRALSRLAPVYELGRTGAVYWDSVNKTLRILLVHAGLFGSFGFQIPGRTGVYTVTV